MSVLQLRRDMVVVEEEPAVEIETPFPLRTIDAEVTDVTDIEEVDADDDERPRKSFFQVVRWWFNVAAVAVAILVYPVGIMMASDVGDSRITSMVDRTKWTAPWAGGAAMILERHFGELGWASDSPSWAPMARLTGKPAFQTAMASAMGEFVGLVHTQITAAGQDDPDLAAAARLVSASSTGVQLRAARDALVNYDRRMRRRSTAPSSTPAQLAGQLALIETWAAKSQTEIAASAAVLGGSPIDDQATRAVYAAKGRAMAAWVFLDTMHWPDNTKAAAARSTALEAWRTAAQFHPLVVLNGSPDGSLLGNHAVAMGFLVTQAQKATQDFIAAVEAPAAAPGIANNAAPMSVLK
jgi:hypothetical protein